MEEAGLEARIKAALASGDAAALAALLDARGARALDAAAAAGKADVLAWLLGEQRVAPSRSAVVAAAGGGHAEALRLLLERAAELGLDSGAWLQEALLRASDPARTECMQLLLQRGARPDAQALVAVADSGSVPAFELLLQAGARLDAEGATALWLAAQEAESAALPFLLARGVPAAAAIGPDGSSALHWAVGCGDVGAVEDLLEAGADAARAMPGGDQPIHRLGGCFNNNDNDMPGDDEWTVEEDAEPILMSLLEAGADIDAPGAGGRRLVHALAAAGTPRGVQMAADLGADMSAVDGAGKTAWDVLGAAAFGAEWGVAALGKHLYARVRAERDALSEELRQERAVVPQGLRSLVTGAAAEMKRLDAARARAGVLEKAHAKAAAEAPVREAEAEAEAHEAAARLARAQARLRALREEGFEEAAAT
jgi:ankyrin repeat protein